MMKNGHAFSGLAVGLAVGLLTKAPPALGITNAAIVAGAALIPDIDQPQATIARVFGPVSQAFARRVNDVSAAVYERTAAPLDDERDGGHRGLTHTLVFAAALGLLCSFGAQWTAGLAAVLFLCVSLALRGLLGNWASQQGRVRRRTRSRALRALRRVLAKLRGWVVTTLIAAALTTVLVLALPEGYGTGQLGLLVGLGCAVHCWGDSLTLSGCPWLFPIKINGQRWYPIGTPEFLRFRAGGTGEKRLVLPGWIAAAAALAFTYVPGGWAVLGSLGGQALALAGL
jgi:membrane-bound metal-dependent hydrolase YbcI (DUF457 family)